jgi:hypothetical protein
LVIQAIRQRISVILKLYFEFPRGDSSQIQAACYNDITFIEPTLTDGLCLPLQFARFVRDQGHLGRCFWRQLLRHRHCDERKQVSICKTYTSQRGHITGGSKGKCAAG